MQFICFTHITLHTYANLLGFRDIFIHINKLYSWTWLVSGSHSESEILSWGICVYWRAVLNHLLVQTKIQIIVCVFPQVGRVRKTAARRREYHILFMVITTVVCYLLCWMPYGVVAMMATFGHPGIITPIASVVPSLLAKSSTVINPMIYILMNKQVRLFKPFNEH